MENTAAEPILLGNGHDALIVGLRTAFNTACTGAVGQCGYFVARLDNQFLRTEEVFVSLVDEPVEFVLDLGRGFVESQPGKALRGPEQNGDEDHTVIAGDNGSGHFNVRPSGEEQI